MTNLTELERMTVLAMAFRKLVFVVREISIDDDKLLDEILAAAEIPIGTIDKARVVLAVNEKLNT